MPTFNDYLALSSAVYQDDSQVPLAWTLILPSDPNANGYQGRAFFNAATNEIVLVNRGTDELRDLVSGAQILLDFTPDQYADAERFYNDVKAEAISRGATLTITGHSLGGSLTQLLVANHTGDSFNGQPLSGVTFNALGAKSLLNDYGLNVNATYSVMNFLTPTDPIGKVKDHIGTVDISLPIPPFNVPSVILPPAFLVNLFLEAHEITSIPEGFLIKDTPTEPSEFTVVGNQLIQTFVKDRGFAPDINGVVLLGGNKDELGLVIDGGAENDLIFGGEQHDLLTGQAGDDVLYGGDGNDTLIGNSGADIMLGEAGDDTYAVENSGDRVIEAANEGIDTVISEVSFTLPDNVENLTLTGAAVTGTGNDLNNTITGNVANNILAGGQGNDTLLGGAGFDTYLYNAGDGSDTIEDSDGRGAILVDGHLLQGGVHKADDAPNIYTSLDGSMQFQVIGGDLYVNVDGNQIKVNQNFQSGQLGIRLYEEPTYGPVTRTSFTKEVADPNNPWQMITVPFFDDQGNDSRSSALQPAMGDDNNLVHALGGADFVLGGAGDDQLYGDDGNDTLYGGLGDDRLYGGTGSDVLVGDDSADPNSGGRDYLDGGDGDDLMQGNAGADVLIGGSGNDNLNGDDPFAQNLGMNDDFLDGGEGDDQLHGAAGSDVLQLERMAA